MGDPIILEVEVLVAGEIYFSEVENGCKYLIKLVLVTWLGVLWAYFNYMKSQ